MSGFVGRRTELAVLRKRLDHVTATATGVAVTLRGRRQVGKSRLVQEFCDRAGVPYFYFTATKGMSPVESAERFSTDLRDSRLPTDPEQVPTVTSGNWTDALRVLAGALPSRPSIVVIDELPWPAEQDEVFDGALQTAWDRLLSTRPVLLLLLGSDLHMMQRLTSYERPFFGRADAMVLGPLNSAEIGRALGLAHADAIDAHLLSGGLPGILRAWPSGTPPLDFVETECADPFSPLFGVPESVLLAEFPTPDQSQRVLEAIGAGDRTQAAIAAAAGGRAGPLKSGSLSPLLARLVHDKRIIAADQPLSTQPGRPTLYRIADHNLRLYLGMLRTAAEQSRRGRPEAAFRGIERRWPSLRGRAVEPVIREALTLAARAGELPWAGVEAVGGWWNRRFDPEIDLVGVDRSPVARTVLFTGSIKWLSGPFDRHDLAALRRGALAVPGFTTDTALTAVSLSGLAPDVPADDLALAWGPEDVVRAWG
ncbi:ATPase [Spongiactinospora gelatinilytica]|uniref:ATPase n=1 Tax=Spongiactinospora gelatinilytica TaxID=2666298 RepID=A0A2W2EVD1_9ACTN|nr:ATP-binding protein [Spongiactinospora gelatinilytica]PZG26603.1 ATPase [Spongiactinospora gelatinilytica]